MLETSTKIHLVRNYEEHLYSQTSNWSNSIRFIHPSRPKKRLVCQETSTPIVLCTLLHQASGCCASVVHVQQMQRQVIYWVQKIQVLYSGQGGFAQGQTFLGRSGLNNMQSTGSSNKKWRRTSILHQQWNYSILHAFFLTPTTNLVFRPGHMVFSIINHPEEKHNFLGLGQGLGNTVAKLGHHICGSCTQALVPCACCGCCWGGGGRVLPKSGWRVLKQKKEPVYM